jgi:hypothetical protein
LNTGDMVANLQQLLQGCIQHLGWSSPQNALGL